MSEKDIADAYNSVADNFLFSRTKGKEKMGMWNREIEQPMMFNLVPQNLKGKKLLDVGCGPGIHIKEYERRGAKCFGFDISREMILLAKKRCPHSEFTIGSVNKINYPDYTFNIVTASLILDHVKDLSLPFNEIKRVLKKRGLFIFSVPHPIGNLITDKENEITLDASYYRTDKIYLNIAGGEGIVDYPKTIQYYTDLLLTDFELINFIENKPDELWKEKYPDLDKLSFRIPRICFFAWRKK